MDKNKFKLSLKLVLAPIAVTVVLAIAVLLEVRFLRTALDGVDHSDQVISADRQLIKLNLDMETGLRGFQYTGREVFLQPYTEAAGVVDRKFATLAELVSGDPTQRAQLASIRAGFEQWRLLTASAIARRADHAIHDSEEVRYEQALERKGSMDAIRALHEVFDTQEELLRSQHERDVRSGS